MKSRINTKRLLAYVLTVLMLLLAQPYFASKGYAADDKVVRLGFFESKGMFEGAGENGIKRGYCYEYMMQVAAYTGWKYEFVYGSFGDLYEKLKNGEIDVLPYTNYNEQRGREVLFPTRMLIDEEYYIVGRPDRKTVPGSPAALAGGSAIATIKGADFNSMLDEYVRKNGSDIRIKYYPTWNECWNAFRNGETDAAVSTSLTFSNDHETVISFFGKKPTYVAFNRNKPELLVRFNEAADLLEKENPAFLGKLYVEYFSNNPMRRILTQEEKEWLKQHPVLHIGGFANDAPFLVGKDGQAVGLSVDMVNSIFDRLQLDTKADLRSYASLQEMQKALDAGEIDLIAPFYHDYFIGQQLNLIVSNQLAEVNMGLVYKKGASYEDAIAQVATPYTKLGIFYVGENFPDSKVVNAIHIQDAVDKVREGKAQGAIAQGIALNHIKEKYDDLGFLLLEKGCEVCYATRPQNYPLIRILNRGLSYFPYAERAALAARHTPETQITTRAYLASHKEYVLTVGFVLLLAALYALYRSKRRQEREKAQQLIVENNTRLMALEDNFEALYEVNLETENYIPYVKGDTYTREVKDKLLEPTNYFENLRPDIDLVVYEPDRDGLYNVLAKENLVRRLDEEGSFDHYYRIMMDGTPVWFRIRVAYKDAGKKNVVIGVFDAREEVAAREKEKKLRDELIARMSGGEGLFLVDCSTDTKKTIDNNNPTAGEFPDDEKYSEAIRRYINTYVAAPDRAMLLEVTSIPYMLGQTEPDYKVNFKDTSNDRPKFYELRVARFSDTEMLLSFAEKDREIFDGLVLGKLKDDYFGIFAIDLDEKLALLVKKSPWYKGEGQEGEHFPFDIAMKAVIAEVDDEEGKKFFERISSIDYLRKRFAEEDKATFAYKSSKVTGEKWVNASELVLKRNSDGTPSLLALGFSLLDDDASQKEELRLQLRRSMNIVGGLASEYTGLDYLDLDTEIYTPYQIDKKIEDIKPYFDRYPRFSDLFREFVDGPLVHPEDKESLQAFFPSVEAVRRALDGKKKISTLFRRNYNGKFLWTELALVKCEEANEEAHNVIVGFAERDSEVREKQELRQAEEIAKRQMEYALEKAHTEARRNDLLYDIVNGGKWVYDVGADGEVLAAHYSDKTRGLSDTEVVGTPMGWLEHLHPEDRERVTAEFRAATSDRSGNTPYDTTFRLLESNGECRWVKSSGRLLCHEDGSGELLGMTLDITDQINKEKEQQRKLQDALIMAESANNAKSSFLFNMSHDIRTPMNAILGFTQMVRKNADNREKVGDYTGKIEQAGNHLLGLINDVLEMSRIESGKITLNEEPTDIRKISEYLNSMLQNLALAKKINLSFDTAAAKHEFLYVDELRTNQVLINIISNAIKYTPEGGTVKCTVEHLESPKPGYTRARFTVADNGIGMSKEFVQKIFEPFSREKSSTISHVQGTGLGMSIVKKIVDLMRGKITVQSELGKGTTITVEADFRIADKVETKSGEKVTVDFSGRKVLLVEDNELNREIAVAILEESGFVVDTAEDGVVAVEKLKAAKTGDYDVILMDIQMPRMDGHEATRQIRSLGTAISKIPIIAMTANAFEEDRKAALEAGMNEHIAKPINVEVLRETLAKFLR